MDAADIIVLLFSGCTMVSMMAVALIPVILIGSMLVLPFVYQAKWKRWTSGTVAEAYDNVAEGATRGIVQIRPASYLWEKTIAVEAPPAQAVAGLDAHYRKMPFVTMLRNDDDGIAVDLRIPSGLGPGWIAVMKVEPGDDGGSRVLARHRSTFCFAFPVITFFLALSLNLHQARIVKMATATD